MSWLLRTVFGISPNATSFQCRRFRGGAGGGRERIELIGQTFTQGYHAALESPAFATLSVSLDSISFPFRGFAYEGAAMGLSLRDVLIPWRRGRTAAFLAGPGARHTYMVHVGVGWLMAKIGCRLETILPKADPLLRWLGFDGWGFHHGFFKWPRYLSDRPPPGRLKGYERRVFDQGLGRSLWFIDGTDVERIPRTIASLAAGRHADLWSGVGLAATYAGEVGEMQLEALIGAAGPYRPQLAQGAAFAAKARHFAGNVLPYTERACQVFCGMSAEEAASATDVALEGLPAEGAVPNYEIWRWRLHDRFAIPMVTPKP